VPIPAVRTIVKEMDRELKGVAAPAVIRFALVLTKRGSIEGRQVGYEVVARRPDAVVLLDRRVLERLGHGNDNWASVDAFATSLTGPAWREGRLSDREVLEWARSSDPWWRRTALVSTVPLNTRSRGGHGDTRRTLRICRAVLSEMSPMLAKALSWALRSLVPHDPAAVRAFLDTHADELPALVRREVSAKLETGRKSRRGAT
jgi:3-methyladenine DNA glycosylase AlkD